MPFYWRWNDGNKQSRGGLCFHASLHMILFLAEACSDVECAIECQHGFKQDDTGCNICECEEPPIELMTTMEQAQGCPLFKCRPCPGGLYLRDKNNCQTCQCEDEIADGCLDFHCDLTCPEGFRVNADDCRICECNPPKANEGEPNQEIPSVAPQEIDADTNSEVSPKQDEDEAHPEVPSVPPHDADGDTNTDAPTDETGEDALLGVPPIPQQEGNGETNASIPTDEVDKDVHLEVPSVPPQEMTEKRTQKRHHKKVVRQLYLKYHKFLRNKLSMKRTTTCRLPHPHKKRLCQKFHQFHQKEVMMKQQPMNVLLSNAIKLAPKDCEWMKMVVTFANVIHHKEMTRNRI